MESARRLIANDARVDAGNVNDNSALCVGILNLYGTIKVLHLLLDHGPDVHHTNVTGQSVINIARVLEDSPVCHVFPGLL